MTTISIYDYMFDASNKFRSPFTTLEEIINWRRTEDAEITTISEALKNKQDKKVCWGIPDETRDAHDYE